ncbi:MAG: (2Fe-2S)-binding protein [Acidobacteria bacterium]|nr:(2Fe-2S)-binding protein [Acidobacteriota bacterium]
MVKITIDGQQLEVPEGTTILQAAMNAGIEIPHYCYHPGLSIAGNCRICLVELEKAPRPVIACNTVVAEGMVVYSKSPRAIEWQNGVSEFLLINHPLDCPICDQAGECRLQDYSYRYGQPTTRFVEEKVHGPKRRPLGQHIVFDWERCIKCTRCIRFCEEVTGTAELGMFLRGVREEIGVFPGRPLDNPYSGNTVDICPVGALTLKEFRFRSRLWFLTDVPTVCPGCARGCSTMAAVLRNEIFRITPRENQAVNRWWICDHGRLWWQRLEQGGPRRLSGPRGARPAGDDAWETAYAEAAELLATAARGRGVRILASSRAGLEELWLLGQIARACGAQVHLPQHERGADDELLLRRDWTPNARGAREVLGVLAGGAVSVAELERALAEDHVDVLLALGPGLVGPVDDEPPVIAPGALACARSLIVLDAHASALSDAATVLLPVTGYGESAATYVNFAGRVQHAPKGLTPRGDVRPARIVLGEFLARLASLEGPPSLAEVQAALSRDVPALAAIDWAALPGSGGQDLAGVDAAAQACRPTGAALKMLAAGLVPAGT